MSVALHQEVSKFLIPAVANDETKTKWHGSVLTSLTAKGLTIQTFSKDYKRLTKEINYVEYFIDNPQASATAQLIPETYVPNLSDNLNYTQLIVDPILWPHNPQLEAEATRIVDFNWAPTTLIFNNNYILTTLSCTGNVLILTYIHNKWETKFDLTRMLLEINPPVKRIYKSTKELREVIEVYASSATCWQPSLVQENSCFFVTAQKNGYLNFWILNSDNFSISVNLVSSHKVACTEVVSMTWLPITNAKFQIICLDLNGKVSALEFSVETDKINSKNTLLLWESEDRMIPQDLCYKCTEEHIILVFSKNRHLVVQILDKEMNLKKQLVKNINDYKITSITQDETMFYAATVNGILYAVNIKTDNSFDVDVKAIQLPTEITENLPELQCITFSRDYSFLVLSYLNIVPSLRKHSSRLELLTLNHKPTNEIVSALINNPQKKLSDFWESIEYLRQRSLKIKSLPEIDYKHLFQSAQSDIYKLKLYLIFLTWHQNLKVNLYLSDSMPESCVEKVRERILFLHAISNIKQLVDKCTNITNFHNETLIGTKKYIIYYSKKYQESIDKYIDVKKIENINENIRYTCQSCDSEMEYFACKDRHFSLFCIQTFTPIESEDYLSCSNCNVVARSELGLTKPFCLFCDVLLRKS